MFEHLIEEETVPIVELIGIFGLVSSPSPILLVFNVLPKMFVVSESVATTRMAINMKAPVMKMALRPMVCGRKGHTVGDWQEGSSLLPEMYRKSS